MKFLRTTAQNIRVQAHTVWLCARDPALGWPLRLFALFIAGYALSPIDLIPDFIPILGLVDDALLIPVGVWLFCRLAPSDIIERNREIAKAAASRPTSKAAAIMIIGLWLGLLIWLGHMSGFRLYFQE